MRYKLTPLSSLALAALAILPTLVLASPLLDGGDPAVIACGTSSPQYSTPPSVSVAASGTTQSSALTNLYAGGMTDDFADSQNVVC